jgi:hypothetical protein
MNKSRFADVFTLVSAQQNGFFFLQTLKHKYNYGNYNCCRCK